MALRSNVLAPLAAGALLTVGCAGSGESVSTTADVSAESQADATGDAGSLGDSDDVFSESSGSGAAPDSGAEPGSETAPVVVSYDPVVETGVPGIDSDDAFCRSWSEYAGSVQALSLAWFVQTPMQAATLEVAASDALRVAVEQMAAHLPAEIESNRQALTVDVPEPVLRRADRSRQFLLDAGVADATIGSLGDAWIAAIVEAGLDAEDVMIALPPDVDAAAVAEAADALVAALPSFIEDPSLDTTQFDIGPSLSYISDNCPDQATLAGDDNID